MIVWIREAMVFRLNRMIYGFGQAARSTTRRYTKIGESWISLPRNELFAGFAILGCANGLGAKIIESISEQGLIYAVFNLFGISAIVWLACITSVVLMLCQKTEKAHSTDLVAGAGLILLVIFPTGWTSWLAMTALSLYVLQFAHNLPLLRRGAVILLATTVPMLWSRLLFQLFSNFILEIDASLVKHILGTYRSGNMVRFADNSGYLVILPSCSSLANVSLAILCWVTVTQLVQHRRALTDLVWCTVACASVVAVNIGRMGLMALSGWHYETFHNETGEVVVSLIMTVLVLGFSILGVRRELFSRA